MGSASPPFADKSKPAAARPERRGLADIRRAFGRSRAPLSLVVATALAALLVAAPILFVASSVFSPRSAVMAHLASTVLPDILFNTIAMALVVGAGSTIIGVSCAWLVTQCRFPGSRALGWLLLLPLAIPGYIVGYAYADFLTFAGPLQTGLRETFGWTRRDYWFPDIFNVWGVGVILTLVLYPYVYLLARAAFLEHTSSAFDAARSLGRGPWTSFFRVALPLARPAIAAGVALALMEARAEFGTVQYYGVNTFTTAIYRTWFGLGDRIAAAQLATGLLVFVILVIVLEQYSRGARRFTEVGRSTRRNPAFELRGLRAALASFVCALPVLLGFVAPVLILLRLHLIGGDAVLGEAFWSYARNSFVLAGVAAALTVAVALLLAYVTRLAPGGPLLSLVRVASLGYAIPGTVVAVGALATLGAIDASLDAVARAAIGAPTGLLLSGTVVAVLFAYLVRFLAVAYGALEAGFAKIPRNFDEAARGLGRRPAGVVARVHIPLLRGSIGTAALIVFVDVLKELPATLILRPFNFDTLAVRVYQLASDERLAQSSTGSLAIVLVALAPVLLLMRMTARGSASK